MIPDDATTGPDAEAYFAAEEKEPWLTAAAFDERRIDDGYEAARQQAADICTSFADDLDVRSELAKRAGARPQERVRRLRQAADRISNMQRPDR